MSFHYYDNLFFTTSTILNWQKLLCKNEAKEIIYNTWRFLHDQKRCIIYAYVIMPNHVHWLYHVLPPFENHQIKHSFLSFTSKKLLGLDSTNPLHFIVNKRDRQLQIWKRDSLSVSINSNKFLIQKMNYIHNNPVVSFISPTPEKYEHSSYKYYLNSIGKPNFLTLW